MTLSTRSLLMSRLVWCGRVLFRARMRFVPGRADPSGVLGAVAKEEEEEEQKKEEEARQKERKGWGEEGRSIDRGFLFLVTIKLWEKQKQRSNNH